ncbi:metallophosphoesterase [Bdellovibrio sp. HCB337]|uniref:metallophosphoesterase n=1 Tax=Bdellovibrio sp. HCB337 TaxID=3394358 RepID=UPI0039A6E992
MFAVLKLVNLIYIPLAILAHLLVETYLVKPLSLPVTILLFTDALMVFAFAMRLSKRKIHQAPILRPLIQFSLLCFSFFSFYIPCLIILAIADLFFEISSNMGLLAFAVSIGMTLYQAWAVQTPVLRQIQIPLPSRFQSLKGLSFVHISDLHLGPFLGAGFVEHLVQQIANTPAEFVCLTGDLMDGPYNAYKDCIEPLKKLTAIKTVYFVTGNHEYYYDANLWIQELQSMGVTVLRSETKFYSWNNSQLAIAGIDDSLFKNPQEAEFREQLSTLKAPCLLLSHRPETWDIYKNIPVALQLSGHGHGGQAFPWAFIIRKVMKYPFGLFQDNDSSLYVHSGTGFWGPPNRWLNPPEVCRIELV